MTSAAEHPPFAVTADLVVLTIQAGALAALVVTRREPPFKGRRALPGGFVRIDENLEAAARRELAEETGLRIVRGSSIHLEQLATYGDPGRDPRQRVVTVAHLALVAELPQPRAGTDAATASIEPVAELLAAKGQKRLAFDHDRILRDGIERARAKLEYSTLATTFLPDAFTIGELRQVYEAVWGTEIDPRNFHRKVQASVGFVEPLDETTTRGGGRPAMLFRAGDASDLFPPLVRPLIGDHHHQPL